ncbi:MAG: AbrB/MazE/SpoVT family DNA-binding domain-containing protein [Pseudomonadota bacterium]
MEVLLIRVTSKGQVTIPKNIRERLGISPGDEVSFVEGDFGVELVASGEDSDREGRLRQFDAALKKYSGSLRLGMTTDE